MDKRRPGYNGPPPEGLKRPAPPPPPPKPRHMATVGMDVSEKYIRVLEIQARIEMVKIQVEAMKADNIYHSNPQWNGDNFKPCYDELKELAEKLNKMWMPDLNKVGVLASELKRRKNETA